MHGTILELEDTILQQQDDIRDLKAKVLEAKVPREVDMVTRYHLLLKWHWSCLPIAHPHLVFRPTY